MAAELALPPFAVKRCWKCGVEKPLEQFGKNASKKDGRDGRCKECAARWHREHFDREKNGRRHSNYCKNNRERHGRYNRAYQKRYHLTIDGFIAAVWHRLNSRTINGSHPRWSRRNRPYLMAGIRLELTRDELKAVITANRSVIQAIWAAGGTPSIDRIDSTGHYSADNIQFIPLRENCRKAAYETVAKERAKKLSAQT